ncbi:methyltransferase domain-containing protein [Candidatus Berkelbacteria bacterium]|nr:methyltransferase domain-containing protein [Candidatus Berkelbacteria bacterium]
MSATQAIINEIEPLCYLVERKIVGQANLALARSWAHSSAIRHAKSIDAIEHFARIRSKDKLRILNASGLACGHQDFAIASYLAKRYPIDWTVFESPTSPYLENKTLKKMLAEYEIKLELSDFTEDEKLYGDKIYDVILFTEIAEHLDHTTLLRSLEAIRDRLAPNGIIILTTPNLASLGSRLSLLRGNGDLGYWGDGRANREDGLWGHIVYYDIRRLKRLLADSGLTTLEAMTFWYRPDRSPIGRLLYLASQLMPSGRQTIFLVAERGEHTPIPAAI